MFGTINKSLYLNDETCFSACRQILEWGGVTNKNVDRIRQMSSRFVITFFKCGIKILEK